MPREGEEASPMYEPAKFRGVLWHSKDGVREVSVSCGVGAKPFCSDPGQVGVQFLLSRAEEGEEGEPLAVLFIDRDDARSALGETGALLKGPDIAQAIKVAISKVLEQTW
jgi:hypothetical protein